MMSTRLLFTTCSSAAASTVRRSVGPSFAERVVAPTSVITAATVARSSGDSSRTSSSSSSSSPPPTAAAVAVATTAAEVAAAQELGLALGFGGGGGGGEAVVGAVQNASSLSSQSPLSSQSLLSSLWFAGGCAAAAAMLLSAPTASSQSTSSSSSLIAETTTTTTTTTRCDYDRRKSGAGDVGMLAPTKEPSTGILFPRLCNGMTFVGCGVRVKWGFVKVYAVGTYMDPIAMSAIKKEAPSAIGKALLDPMYPRVIRIVMNRSLSIEKYTKAIVEALEPRMNGEDLEKLEEFKKLNPPVDLVEGAEMEMTIRGDTMLYKNSAGGVGAIHSQVFCRALCDVYYGADAVSPAHREEVIKGIQAL